MITLKKIVYDILNTVNRGESEEVNISKRQVAFKVEMLRQAKIQLLLDEKEVLPDSLYQIVNVNVDTNDIGFLNTEDVLKMGIVNIPKHLSGEKNNGIEWIKTGSRENIRLVSSQELLDKIEVDDFSLYYNVHGYIEKDKIMIYPYIATVSVKIIPESLDIVDNQMNWEMPYPINGKIAREIVLEILSNDFQMELKSIPDPYSDQESQRNHVYDTQNKNQKPS